MANKFAPGTAKVKIGWLLNYASSGDTIWFSSLSFGLALATNWSDILNKPTTLAEYGITDITSHKSTNPVTANNTTVNAIGYSNGISLLGQTDGGLLTAAYDSS